MCGMSVTAIEIMARLPSGASADTLSLDSQQHLETPPPLPSSPSVTPGPPWPCSSYSPSSCAPIPLASHLPHAPTRSPSHSPSSPGHSPTCMPSLPLFPPFAHLPTCPPTLPPPCCCCMSQIFSSHQSYPLTGRRRERVSYVSAMLLPCFCHAIGLKHSKVTVNTQYAADWLT